MPCHMPRHHENIWFRFEVRLNWYVSSFTRGGFGESGVSAHQPCYTLTTNHGRKYKDHLVFVLKIKRPLGCRSEWYERVRQTQTRTSEQKSWKSSKGGRDSTTTTTEETTTINLSALPVDATGGAGNRQAASKQAAATGGVQACRPAKIYLPTMHYICNI